MMDFIMRCYVIFLYKEVFFTLLWKFRVHVNYFYSLWNQWFGLSLEFWSRTSIVLGKKMEKIDEPLGKFSGNSCVCESLCVLTCAQRLWPSHQPRTSSLWGKQRGPGLKKPAENREVNHSRINSRLESLCPHVIRSCLTHAGTESKILLMKGYQRQEKPSYISRVNPTCRQKRSQPSCCLHNLSTGCKNNLNTWCLG